MIYRNVCFFCWSLLLKLNAQVFIWQNPTECLQSCVQRTVFISFSQDQLNSGIKPIWFWYLFKQWYKAASKRKTYSCQLLQLWKGVSEIMKTNNSQFECGGKSFDDEKEYNRDMNAELILKNRYRSPILHIVIAFNGYFTVDLSPFQFCFTFATNFLLA